MKVGRLLQACPRPARRDRSPCRMLEWPRWLSAYLKSCKHAFDDAADYETDVQLLCISSPVRLAVAALFQKML